MVRCVKMDVPFVPMCAIFRFTRRRGDAEGGAGRFHAEAQRRGEGERVVRAEAQRAQRVCADPRSGLSLPGLGAAIGVGDKGGFAAGLLCDLCASARTLFFLSSASPRLRVNLLRLRASAPLREPFFIGDRALAHKHGVTAHPAATSLAFGSPNLAPLPQAGGGGGLRRRASLRSLRFSSSAPLREQFSPHRFGQRSSATSVLSKLGPARLLALRSIFSFARVVTASGWRAGAVRCSRNRADRAAWLQAFRLLHARSCFYRRQSRWSFPVFAQTIRDASCDSLR
jgi:hypothetical protein